MIPLSLKYFSYFSRLTAIRRDNTLNNGWHLDKVNNTTNTFFWTLHYFARTPECALQPLVYFIIVPTIIISDIEDMFWLKAIRFKRSHLLSYKTPCVGQNDVLDKRPGR